MHDDAHLQRHSETALTTYASRVMVVLFRNIKNDDFQDFKILLLFHFLALKVIKLRFLFSL